MSPQWLLRLTRGGFVGFLARWWWGRRRAGAPLRCGCGELWWLQWLTESYCSLRRVTQTAAAYWIRFRRAVKSTWVRMQRTDA